MRGVSKWRVSLASVALVAALAAWPAHADVFLGTVSMLEVWRNGNVAFTLNTSVGTCNQQFVINASAPGAKNQYAAVLSAKTTGRRIRVDTSGCGPADNYGSSYNIPEYIQVQD